MNGRAQSVGLARYILAFIGGAAVIWIVFKITNPILDGAAEATNSSQANQATTWIGQGIDFMPVWFLLVGFIGLLVLAIFQRQLLG